MIDKTKTCCFTGHRLISKDIRLRVQEGLASHIAQLSQKGITTYLCGGALGFDTMAALAVLEARAQNPSLQLVMALPCREQAQSWTAKNQQQYRLLLEQADTIHYISETYDRGCMMRRNRFMVDHARHCIFYLSRMGSGTGRTVAYAIESGLELHNVL